MSEISPVRAQYEAYPYPARDPRDEARRLILGSPSDLRELDHYLFGGARDLRRPFRALIAGGGTGDAAIMLAQQLANAALDLGLGRRQQLHEVVYLDLSAAARRIAEARAAARGLANLRFVTGSLFELERLAPGPYDYIDCCGVLHHLVDPPAGLAALKAALVPDGGLGLMVYGALGRRGVYELQGLLRGLAAELPLAEQVALARRLLGQLPGSNWFRRNPFLADHKQSDAELVDLLLHSQDRAYRVEELLALVAGAGLRLVSFIEPLRYAPESYVTDPELQRRLAALPGPQRWAAAEALAGNMKTHVCYLTQAAGDTVARLADEAVPLLPRHSGPELARAVTGHLSLKVEIGGLSLRRPLPELAPAILQRIDGRRTLAELRSALQAANPALTAEAFGRAFEALYAAMNGFNLMVLHSPKGTTKAPAA